MKRRQYVLMVGLGIVAGFFGGLMSGCFFAGEPVFAGNASKHQKVIEAEEFRLVDSQGRKMGALEMVDRGNWPALTLWNGKGEIRAMLRLYGSLDEFQEARLVFFDPYLSEPRLEVGVKYGISELNLYDRKGARLIVLSVYDRNPMLEIRDRQGDTSFIRDGIIIGLSSKTEGPEGPYLHMYDKKHRLRVALGSTKLKHVKTGSIEKRSPSSLVLFGEDGKVIWDAP